MKNLIISLIICITLLFTSCTPVNTYVDLKTTQTAQNSSFSTPDTRPTPSQKSTDKSTITPTLNTTPTAEETTSTPQEVTPGNVGFSLYSYFTIFFTLYQ